MWHEDTARQGAKPLAMEMVGFLNVLKPPQMTSHDVVDFVRRQWGVAKVGHLGTLDPPAAGVLPLALGAATRLIQHLPPARKVYRAEVTFGCTSDTLDAAGVVTPVAPAGDLEGLEEACRAFQGEVMQVPPKVSALKVDGRRGYARARQGEEFEMAARPAWYHQVRVLAVDPPRAWLHVDCGPGTYVRSLARDLGERLGCGALLSFLVRCQSGCFTMERSYTLEDVLRQRARPVSCEEPFAEIPLARVDDLVEQPLAGSDGLVRLEDRQGRRGLAQVRAGRAFPVGRFP